MMMASRANSQKTNPHLLCQESRIMLLHLKGLSELGQPAVLPLIVWGIKHFVQIASVLGAY